MNRNIGGRLKALEEQIPRGYIAYGHDRQPTIQSDLTALQWFEAALELLGSLGREAEKKALRQALPRCVGRDNDGGVLYQLVAALDKEEG